MQSVDIKELQAKLSSYVDKAFNGEGIMITDHGKEIALIVPIPSERRAISSLMGANEAKWNGGKPSDIKAIHIKGKSLSKTILEERR